MKKTFLLSMLALALVGCGSSQQKLEDECVYSKKATKFTFWSPVADSMKVQLYDCECGDVVAEYPLRSGKNDFWTVQVKGDLKGKFYTVSSYQNGEWSEPATGIFAKALSINGQRAAIIDIQDTNPADWCADQRPQMTDMTDVVVYETHLRDFTMSPYSGIENKGKFLALTETGTTTADGLASGIDHLKEMGITHLQILPMFDYGSIDEANLAANGYNWGYDPVNYNTPEGGYSTDPHSPTLRILEAKQMIQALHNAGIRVIMDVVYNHTYNVMGCSLGRVVPQYFYRLNEDGSYANGSGCGNETASDKEMMRQFMVESVCYWAREYHIDGFRFDLMGIHDQETMRQIRAALDEIDPTILTYGEGWAAMSPAYPYEDLAMKQFTYKMPRVGAFSDDIRNALIGSPFDHERGFASGKTEENVAAFKFGLVGGIDYEDGLYGTGWSGEPMQHVSYVTCHDNYCLRDRIAVSAKEDSEAMQLRMNKLAQTGVLTSQGMTFLYGGEELYRTKQLIDNSFQSPDSINIIPWENKQTYNDLFEYYRRMIQIRREHKGFRLGSADIVREHVRFLDSPSDDVVVYAIQNLEGIDKAKNIVVIFNGSRTESYSVAIPQGEYTILAEDGRANANGIRPYSAAEIEVTPISATILVEL